MDLDKDEVAPAYNYHKESYVHPDFGAMSFLRREKITLLTMYYTLEWETVNFYARGL